VQGGTPPRVACVPGLDARPQMVQLVRQEGRKKAARKIYRGREKRVEPEKTGSQGRRL